MEDNKNTPAVEIDETELDNSLESDLAAMAESSGATALPPKQEEPKPETPSGEAPKVDPPSQDQKADIPGDDSQNVIAESFKTPVKGKFESDESYDKRVELANLVAQRKTAKTDEENGIFYIN